MKYFPPQEIYLGALPRPDIQIAVLVFTAFRSLLSAGSCACHLLPPAPPSFHSESTSPTSQTPGHHSLLSYRLPTNITFSCLTVLEEGTASAQLLAPYLGTVHQGHGASRLLIHSREWHLIWVSSVPQIHAPNILHWEQ